MVSRLTILPQWDYCRGDVYGANVTYCFMVSKTGGTYLDKIVTVDGQLSLTDDGSMGTLAPGSSAMLSQHGTVTGSFPDYANASGHPNTPDERDILDLANVTATDPSEIGQKQNSPVVAIDKYRIPWPRRRKILRHCRCQK